MARCAQVLNGTVVNIVLADPATFAPGDGSQIVASDTAQIGDTYAGGVFTHHAAAVVYQTSGLSFLQFLALFTPAEQLAVAGSSDPRVGLFMDEATGATAIDLTDARVIAGVNFLASLNLIAASRVATILSGAAPT